MRPPDLAVTLVVLALAAPARADDEATAPGTVRERAVAKRTRAGGDDRKHGMASYYSKRLAGRKTASGERYDPAAMTAAHPTLPMGTKLKVTNPKTDKSVVVTVNDRGPVPKGRVVDLSAGAASELGMTKAGVARVETEVVSKPDGKTGDGR